jgi:release factor glutamine methyltransferase
LNKSESWTILEVLRWTTGFLRDKDVPTPRLDAEVLLAHALATDRVRLYIDFERALTPEELARYRELVKRRARREPVAYIRAVKEFWSLEFEVAPAVLIPRPETELLVEESLKAARSLPTQPPRLPPRLIEVGTGSGAVAVALATELKGRVWATDNSPETLTLARRNARRHGADVEFALADLLEPFASESFDVVVSNPPYVPTNELAHLAPELNYEPRAALDGGEDGLVVIRELAKEAPRVLAKGGWLLLEVGAGQAPEAITLLEAAGLSGVTSARDLSGVERVVKGRKAATTL